MKYTKQQIYTVVAAGLFLVGAVFMLINTFSDNLWAFWVGLGFAVAALVFYLLIGIEHKRTVHKKLTDTSYSDKTDNMNSHEKVASKNKTAKDKIAK